MLGSAVANYRDDPNIEEVNEELVRPYLLRIGSPPQETFVEILPYYRLSPKPQRLAFLELGSPITLVGVLRRDCD